MKLTMNRTEIQEGFVFKKTIYILDYTAEATPEEMSIIEKHKWKDLVAITWIAEDGRQREDKVFMMLRGSNKKRFSDIAHRIDYEGQLVEQMKTLKHNLQSVQEQNTGGPIEVEL
jgi:hypothetical protein